MQLKSYRAKTIQEAIELIRRDLGPDAMVHHTREAPRGLLTRWFLARQVEVTASRGSDSAGRLDVRRAADKAPGERSFASLLVETA